MTRPGIRVADNVRATMAQRQVTVRQLAELVGLTRSAMSRRITGETPFTAEELRRVADCLGVTTDSLTEAVAA